MEKREVKVNRFTRRLIEKATKLKEFIVRVFVIGAVTIISITGLQGVDSYKHEQQYVQQQEIKKEQNRKEIDLNKIIMEQKITNAEHFITGIKNEVEYILLTTSGTMTLEHSQLADQTWEWLNGSKMQVKLTYEATFSLPLNKISTHSDVNGMVYVDYNKNDIQVKSLDVKSHDFSEDRGVFGHKYTKQELVTLIEMSQSKIKDRLNSRVDLKNKAAKNFEETVLCMAKSANVYGITFSGKNTTITTPKYEFKKVVNVKYGYNPNKKISEIKYIVIHSTANPNADVEGHINFYNSSPQADAVHFLVGSDKIAQCLELNQQGQGVKGYHESTGEPSKITNGNSIHLEIMEYTNVEKQKQAIENAEQFVRDVLLPQLEKEYGIKPQVVSHKDAQDKNCPRILYGSTVGISWEDFLGYVNS